MVVVDGLDRFGRAERRPMGIGVANGAVLESAAPVRIR